MDHTQSQKEAFASSPTENLPFSAAIAYGDLVFVSGAIGRDSETGAIAQGDIRAQTLQTMKNIGQTLESAGTSMDRVLKMTVFLVDMRLFQAMNEAYRSFFTSEPPARSCIAVTALPNPDALVEIEAIAAR